MKAVQSILLSFISEYPTYSETATSLTQRLHSGTRVQQRKEAFGMGADANNILAITAGVERGIHLNVQHLAVEVVDHIERSESFAAGQRITHEVHGPDGIRPPVLRRLAERVVAERL